MKRPLASALFFLFPSVSLYGNENFIIQEVVINGQTIHYQIPLQNTKGDVVSHPVDADSSIFRLYTMHKQGSEAAQPLLLDTKSVGTYMPSAEVMIHSQDPHVPARTRADQPYGVTIKVSGLSQAPETPEAGRSVQVARSFKIYDPQTMAAVPGDPGTDYAHPFQLSQNTSFSLSDGNASGGFLPRLDILENPHSQLMGEETFTAYTGGSRQSAAVLAASTIQIWPIASASFSNIEESKTYQNIPIGASIHCVDLYPGCKVYAQIYRGVRGEPQTTPQFIPSAVLQYSAETREPQTQHFPLNDLANFIDEDGQYTIEIMTVTPFNGGKPELIDGGSLTFGVKRKIHVNSGIYTIE